MRRSGTCALVLMPIPASLDGRLGLQVLPLRASNAVPLGIAAAEAARISHVCAGTPAGRAAPGDAIRFEILRAGELREVVALAGPAPAWPESENPEADLRQAAGR